MAVVRRAAIKQKRELVYFTFILVLLQLCGSPAGRCVCVCVIQVHLCEAFHLNHYLRDSGAISTLSRSPRSTVVVVKTLRRAADNVARLVSPHHTR